MDWNQALSDSEQIQQWLINAKSGDKIAIEGCRRVAQEMAASGPDWVPIGMCELVACMIDAYQRHVAESN